MSDSLDLRSVHYMNGSFYDAVYNEVFMPLDKNEKELFENLVRANESKITRKLTYNELIRIGRFIEDRNKR